MHAVHTCGGKSLDLVIILDTTVSASSSQTTALFNAIIIWMQGLVSGFTLSTTETQV